MANLRNIDLPTIRVILAVGFLLALPGRPAAAAERSAAPDFKLQDSGNAMRRLSDFRGKIVLLNFWATWCAPCRTEIPWLNEIHAKYKDRGFSVIGVAMDERGWRAVTPFIAQYEVDYPVLLGNPRVARLYGGLQTLPKTLFLDREGRIVAVHEAILSIEHLTKIVELLLAEPQRAATPETAAAPKPGDPSNR